MCRSVRLALVRVSSRLAMNHAEQANSTPTTIVLLGASNLTRGISTVVETLRLMHGSPLRIFTAMGHGRSYGLHSSVLGRSLCSMLECNLWSAVTRESNGHAPRFALLTDIGNDIMYGAMPEQIVGWIEQCIDRLEECGVQHMNITALPTGSLRRVKRWQFAIVRAVLFPSRHIKFETAISRALETQDLIEDLVRQRGPMLRLVQHDGDWYGFDPIHIRRRNWPAAWTRFLAENDHASQRARRSFRRWQRLRRHMPARYDLFGWPRTCAQPLRIGQDIHIEMY